MAEKTDLKKEKKPDPQMLANLELLMQMEKIKMIRDLHLQESLDAMAAQARSQRMGKERK